MSQVTVKALILRSNPATENDRYVRLLSSEYGLIEAYARGALRSKSKLLATTEAFSLCEFNLFTNKEKYYVNQANFVYPFAKLKKNIEALTAAAHLSDIAIDVSQSLEQFEALYQLMVYGFYALEQAVERSAEALLAATHAGEIRLLALAGYPLEFAPCSHCSLALDEIKNVYFSFPRMQFVCEGEAKQSFRTPTSSITRPSWERAADLYLGQAVWPVSQGLLEALRFFSAAPVQRLFSFSVSKELERELAAFTQAYLMASLEKNYKRLEFLFQLTGI